MVQDDARERQMARLFGLEDGVGRGETDAFLVQGDDKLPFELKSTTDSNESFTTVRDFSQYHLDKWRGVGAKNRGGIHWILAVYDATGRNLTKCYYASPRRMEPWYAYMEAYIRPDTLLAAQVPALVTEEITAKVVGRKTKYTVDEAKAVQKKQYSKAEYTDRMDVKGGYSFGAMQKIVRERVGYLLNRGATLNNPHITAEYAKYWLLLDGPEAQGQKACSAWLRRMVKVEVAKAGEPISA